MGKLMLHSHDYKEAGYFYFVTNINMGKDLIPSDYDGEEEIDIADLAPR